MARKKELNAAVIGYGGAFDMGKRHLEQMAKAGMTPAAVCDLDEKRLKVAQDDFPGISTHTDVASLLKDDVDIITIITPHNTHASLALKCLKAGKHVVLEKPMALSTKECDKMMEAAEKNGVVLSTYHNRHWDGCIVNAVKLLEKGTLGDIKRVEAHKSSWGKPKDWWRSRKSVSGGLLFDWGVHLLEYTLQLMRSDIVEVNGYLSHGHWAGQVKWKDDANEDEGHITVRYANGSWSSLLISTIEPSPSPYWVDVIGTKASLHFNLESFELIKPKAKETVITKGKNPVSRWEYFYQNIADHIVDEKDLVITPQWARRPIHIIDCGYRSAAKGQAVQAKYA